MHDTPKKRMYKANLSCVIGATAINCYYKHTHSATSWIIRGKEKDMKKKLPIFTVLTAALLVVSFTNSTAFALDGTSTDNSGSVSYGYVDGNDVSNNTYNQSKSVCFFSAYADNPHISSTSSTVAIQAHGWWVNGNCPATAAIVKVGLMKSKNNSNPDDYWDVGAQGTAQVASGGGKGKRATAHYDCPAGETAWYKAWVDVDLVGVIDDPTLKWSNTVRVTCKK